MKHSAGCLLYRQSEDGWEVLLVHPSGPYNRRAAWSIPKGLIDAGENAEQTARRETLEETGVTAGELVSLSYIDMKKSRKRVFCFAGPAPDDAVARCASWEVDRAEFVSLPQAKALLHVDQRTLIDRLRAILDP